jgi:hypothetical protein
VYRLGLLASEQIAGSFGFKLDSTGQSNTKQPEEARGGGAMLAFNGVVFGMASGLVLDANVNPNSDETSISLSALAGGVVGGAASYLYLKKLHPDGLSYQKSVPLTAGILLGLGQGMAMIDVFLERNDLVPIDTDGDGIFDRDHPNAVLNGFFLSATLGGAAGLLVGELAEPDPGDSFLVLSSSLWGASLGLGLAAGLGAQTTRTVLPMYDLGLGLGLYAARKTNLSVPKIALLNASWALGTTAGVFAGILTEKIKGIGLLSAAGGAIGLAIGGILLRRNSIKTTTAPNAPSRLAFLGLSPSLSNTKQVTALFSF